MDSASHDRPRRVLVTGATGFIGRALVPALGAAGWAVTAALRAGQVPAGARAVQVRDIGPGTDWSRAMEGAEAVVHLAGLAHARHGAADFARVNVEGTRALATQAARAGLARFVFVSSVKAALDHGAGDESAPPRPGGPYGRSKLEAETLLAAYRSLNPVSLRPPLVHGPDARANFAALLKLADTSLPLPVGGLANRRSLIARDSFCAAVLAALDGRASGAYFLADAPALTLGEMIGALRAGLGRRARLIRAPFQAPVAAPAPFGALEIDAAAFAAAFPAWTPRDSRAALAETARAWKAGRR